MRAIVLCAGLGTRLRPLTEAWPKPAIPLLGQPLFRYTLAMLKRAGVTHVGINNHHLAHVMEATARAECDRMGMSLFVVHEPEIQGTGGGIRGFKTFVGDAPFFAINGDILFAADFGALMAAHLNQPALATLALQPMPPGARYGAVDMDSSGEVRRIGGRGPGGEGLSSWHYVSVQVLSPEVFDFMSPVGPEEIFRDVFTRAMSQGRHVRGHQTPGYWSDLGSPSLLFNTVQDLLSQRVPLEAFPGASPFDTARSVGPGVWTRSGTIPPCKAPAFIDEGCAIHPSVQIGPSVYIGRNAKVGEGARIQHSVVFEGTHIASGEQLDRTVAWLGHRLPI